MFSLEDWHERFTQQASWTLSLRRYIYDKISLASVSSILDIGCGTGVLESELASNNPISVTALDLDFSRLVFARNNTRANWLCSDVFSLPFTNGTFEISLCHYLLLWLKDPIKGLLEMKRVTRPGGYILLLAEPDYTHRIDFPEEMNTLGKWQKDALIEQGAHPGIGLTIGSLLDQSGIEVIETGLSGGQWNPTHTSYDSDLEWKILENDLSQSMDKDQLQKYKDIDNSARKSGTRVLYVPVFYAIGRTPS